MAVRVAACGVSEDLIAAVHHRLLLDATELVGPHDAEDLVQQAWLRILVAGWQPREQSPRLVRTYARTTMRRLAVDQRRRSGRLPVVYLGDLAAGAD